MSEPIERLHIDGVIRQLWLLYRLTSDEHADILTDQDLELWELVTQHKAIQDKLNTLTK